MHYLSGSLFTVLLNRPMRDIIQRHNRINGVKFSVAEFGGIGLFIGTFGAYYIIHGRFALAATATGITLNCLPVVVLGLRQLAQDRANGKPIGSFWDPRAREQHRRENPHMLRDTLALTVGTLLPFVTFLAVLLDIPRQPRS